MTEEMKAGFLKAVEMLLKYDFKSEEIKCCLHNVEWSKWLLDQYEKMNVNDDAREAIKND